MGTLVTNGGVHGNGNFHGNVGSFCATSENRYGNNGNKNSIFMSVKSPVFT